MGERVADPDEITARVDRYNDLGRHTEAERIVRRALRDHPEHSNLLNKLSYSLYCQDRYDEDLDVTTRALELDPDEPVFHLRRGMTLWALDRRDEAVAQLRRGLELDPSPRVRLILLRELAYNLNVRRDFGEAFTVADTGLAAFPGDADLLQVCGEARRRQDRHHEADDYYTAAIAADPRFGMAWYGKGLNDMSLYRARASMIAFDTSMALDPGDAWRSERVRYFMGWVIAGFAVAFRWSLPVAAVLAITGLGPGWLGLGLLAATFGYAINWFHRGGRLAWSAVFRLRPTEKLALALPLALVVLGGAATVAALLGGGGWTAWAGLAAGLLLWPSFGFDTALSPNTSREKPLWRRIPAEIWLWLLDDFTTLPKLSWQRLRHRIAKPSTPADPKPEL